MRFHTYTKFSPESADAVDLQALLDNLADFLLQSGFAGVLLSLHHIEAGRKSIALPCLVVGSDQFRLLDVVQIQQDQATQAVE